MLSLFGLVVPIVELERPGAGRIIDGSVWAALERLHESWAASGKRLDFMASSRAVWSRTVCWE